MSEKAGGGESVAEDAEEQEKTSKAASEANGRILAVAIGGNAGGALAALAFLGATLARSQQCQLPAQFADARNAALVFLIGAGFALLGVLSEAAFAQSKLASLRRKLGKEEPWKPLLWWDLTYWSNTRRVMVAGSICALLWGAGLSFAFLAELR